MRVMSVAELEVVKGLPGNMLADHVDKTEAFEAVARSLSAVTLRYFIARLGFKRASDSASASEPTAG